MSDRRRYCLTIAETTIEVASTDAELCLELDSVQSRFLAESARPDVRIAAAFGYTTTPPSGLIFDANAVWKIYYQNGSYHFTFNCPIDGPLPYKTVTFNPDFSRGTVCLHRPYFSATGLKDPLAWPLDELLMGHLLGMGKGVELHSAGLIDAQGRGHLFVGHSGAGKSTMTRLWEKEPNVVILSDDRIIVREKEGGFFMYGTPWHGDARHASPLSAPLAAIYLLEHGDATRLKPSPAPQAVVGLFTRSITAVYSHDAVAFTLGFMNRLVEAVPCFTLPFVPDKRVVDLVLGLQQPVARVPWSILSSDRKRAITDGNTIQNRSSQKEQCTDCREVGNEG